jgi:lysophospholipase L1-like esterase
MDKKELLNEAVENQKATDKVRIKPNSNIVFIGDSITDAGRDYANDLDLGHGYVTLVAAQLMHKNPNYDLNIYNRGINGDRVADLKRRWEPDCLELSPDIVSILIGINDVGLYMSDEDQLTEEALAQFEEDYRWLLKSLAHRTDARVVMMEPFVTPYPRDRVNWRKHLDPRIQIVRRLANEYHAALIPIDGIINAKGIENDFQTYTGDDGVHPTLTGHALIAEAWLNYIDS